MLTMFNLFWDPTYILIIIGMLLAMGASQYLNSTYRKYARIASSTELTGEEVAKRILLENGYIEKLDGKYIANSEKIAEFKKNYKRAKQKN